MARTVLVTGAAGFIGAALSQRLLLRGDRVVGIDNLNDYYDPNLKQARLRQIGAIAPEGDWRFERLSLEDGDALMALFAEVKPDVVVNLAAQAGVRYSREPSCLYPKQSCWFWPFAGRLSAPWHQPRVRIEQFGIWGEPQFAIP